MKITIFRFTCRSLSFAMTWIGNDDHVGGLPMNREKKLFSILFLTLNVDWATHPSFRKSLSVCEMLLHAFGVVRHDDRTAYTLAN